MPGQGGALHPHRELRRPQKETELADVASFVCLGRLASNEPVKPREQLLCLALGLTLEAGGHHRGRSFGDGAARTFKADILDLVILELQEHREVVAAEWVVALRLPVCLRQGTKVAWLLAMLQDHILIKVPNVSQF